jgi:hypothetical protein
MDEFKPQPAGSLWQGETDNGHIQAAALFYGLRQEENLIGNFNNAPKINNSFDTAHNQLEIA